MNKLNHQYIKHEKFMDLALYIDRVVLSAGPYYIVRGYWVNQGFVDTFPIGYRVKLKIKRDKANEWLICDDKYAKCIRYAQWSRLK